VDFSSSVAKTGDLYSIRGLICEEIIFSGSNTKIDATLSSSSSIFLSHTHQPALLELGRLSMCRAGILRDGPQSARWRTAGPWGCTTGGPDRGCTAPSPPLLPSSHAPCVVARWPGAVGEAQLSTPASNQALAATF
jgi:hypothetical protein